MIVTIKMVIELRHRKEDNPNWRKIEGPENLEQLEVFYAPVWSILIERPEEGDITDLIEGVHTLRPELQNDNCGVQNPRILGQYAIGGETDEGILVKVYASKKSIRNHPTKQMEETLNLFKKELEERGYKVLDEGAIEEREDKKYVTRTVYNDTHESFTTGIYLEGSNTLLATVKSQKTSTKKWYVNIIIEGAAKNNFLYRYQQRTGRFERGYRDDKDKNHDYYRNGPTKHIETVNEIIRTINNC